MKLSILSLIFTLSLATICIAQFSSNPEKMTTVSVYGLIIDSKSLSPVGGAHIYDGKGTQLCVSDESGCFNAELGIENTSGITLQVKKPGYESFLQNERWAVLPSPVEATYYFGLKKADSDARAFSELEMGNSTKDELTAGIEKIKNKIDFENKLKAKKAGNNDLLLSIDDDYYLVNNSGWVKLKSAEEEILINGHKRLSANEINHHFKRNAIKKMSPSSRTDLAYEIETY